MNTGDKATGSRSQGTDIKDHSARVAGYTLQHHSRPVLGLAGALTALAERSQSLSTIVIRWL